MKTWLCWSGGKDSAYALEVARSLQGIEIVGLLTTLSAEFDRISMHGVRRELLEEQAEVLGLPVEKVFLPTPPRDAQCRLSAAATGFTVFASNDSYETAMLAVFQRARHSGVQGIVFGDIYLEDLRRYREMLLARAGCRGSSPCGDGVAASSSRRSSMPGFAQRSCASMRTVSSGVSADASSITASWHNCRAMPTLAASAASTTLSSMMRRPSAGQLPAQRPSASGASRSGSAISCLRAPSLCSPGRAELRMRR